MDNKDIRVLIDKYLDGECTPEEVLQVERWYESYRQTDRVFYEGDQHAIDASSLRSLAAIRLKLGLSSERTGVKKNRRFRQAYQWLAAACVLIMLTAGLLVYRAGSAPEVFISVSTGKGEIKKVVLPDGTRVWLNAGSSLRYLPEFNRNKRQVYLSGEAYFDVASDKGKPFNVNTGQIRTDVLGTAFSVSAYPEALSSTVTLVNGKVRVSHNKKILGVLLPDQSIEYIRSSGKSAVTNVSAEKVISWKSGKLVFIDMPMYDIALRLQQWYGLKFIFKNDALRSRRFTASFNGNIALSDLLSVLQEAAHARYQIDKGAGTVTFQ